MSPIWIQVIDFRNGAYPINEFRNGTPFSETAYLIQNSIGKKLQVVNNCKYYYKTFDTYVNNQPKSFLICKKDCLVL